MNIDRIVDNFIEMVSIDSESRNEKEFADYLVGLLTQLGFEVKRDQSGIAAGSNTNNVYGFLKGTTNATPILFSAHMDTVVPGKSIKPIIKDGVIYSDGTTILGADDKAGIVSVIEAIRCLKEKNIAHGDIEVLFSICEEVGLLGAKHADYTMIKSKYAFVLDSGGDIGNVVIGAPTQSVIHGNFFGKASHAGGAPELGISAIQMAARAINNMTLLRIDEETTANVGIINGGKATNIVCPACSITMEARSHSVEKLDKQNAHLISCIHEAAEYFGGKAEIALEIEYPVMSIAADSPVLAIAKAAAEKINVPFITAIGGGGSDANIFAGHGISPLVIGVGMSKVHTNDEFITIVNLGKSTEYILSIIQTA